MSFFSPTVGTLTVASSVCNFYVELTPYHCMNNKKRMLVSYRCITDLLYDLATAGIQIIHLVFFFTLDWYWYCYLICMLSTALYCCGVLYYCRIICSCICNFCYFLFLQAVNLRSVKTCARARKQVCITSIVCST